MTEGRGGTCISGNIPLCMLCFGLRDKKEEGKEEEKDEEEDEANDEEEEEEEEEEE